MSFESLCIFFTLKSFTEWQDPYNSFNIFKKQNLLKVLWCFSAFSVLLACPHEGAWLLFYFLPSHDDGGRDLRRRCAIIVFEMI